MLFRSTHFNLRVALEKFRDQGILIIGSGMSFHNMRGYSQPNFGPISDEFDQWLVKTFEPNIARRNQDFFLGKCACSKALPPHRTRGAFITSDDSGRSGFKRARLRSFLRWSLETSISGFAFGFDKFKKMY